MSTAGKVLVVLALLLSAAWAALASMVAVLNTNGAQAIAKLEDELKKLETSVVQNQEALRSLKDQINVTQVQHDQDLNVIRARQAEVEKARSETLEMASRVKFQVETVQAAVQAAQADRDRRVAENKAEAAALAAQRGEVQKLQADHAQLTDRLADLRAQFKTTLEQNRALVERLRKVPDRSAPRPAAFTR